MKKYISILFVAVIVVVIFWIYAEKASQADELKPVVLGIDKGDISLTAARAFPIKVKLGINNYSPTSYSLQQLFAEIYDETGNNLLASQTGILTEKTKLKPNQTNELPAVNFDISNLNLIKFLFAGDKTKAVKALAKMVLGGKLGKKIRLKGFIRAEGIKVNLDEIIDI